MKIETLTVGPLEVNCYLLANPRRGWGLVIDPGDEAERLISRIKQLDFAPSAILLTHAHVDHIRGVSSLAAAFSCPVWLHPADHELYHSPANGLPPWLPAAENLPRPISAVPPNETGPAFSVLHTPGHSPGSCCFYFEEESVLFCGDTLFAGSVGRTDLPGGDQAQLLNSIRQQLLPLPPRTRVMPGHGPPTTIEEEKSNNPFLAQVSQPGL